MWHNVGLTLLVFVATLVIVLLLMVCGKWRGGGVEKACVDKCLGALGGHLASQDRAERSHASCSGQSQGHHGEKLSIQGWHPDSR